MSHRVQTLRADWPVMCNGELLQLVIDNMEMTLIGLWFARADEAEERGSHHMAVDDGIA